MEKRFVILVIILISIFLLSCTKSQKTITNPSLTDVCDINNGCDENRLKGNNADYVKIPISEISSNIKKYSFNINDVLVNYFAVKGSDGKIRTAFDACDVCGGYKGYRQRGNDVVCNKCGRFFKIDEIGTKNIGGGCWPSYLNHEIEADYVLINKPELALGVFRFE